MPKETYKQKVRENWPEHREFKEWLRKDVTNASRVFCSYCKCSFTAKFSDIRAHANTKKHASAVGGVVQVNKLNFVKLPTKTSEQEVALCLFVAQHAAILSADHLSQICSQKFAECNAAKHIKVHRTKCTNIINNVLAPDFFEDLREDIGDAKYSLLLDESTDIATTKLLGKYIIEISGTFRIIFYLTNTGVVINYFSTKRSEMVSTFLNLCVLEGGDAKSIADGVRTELIRWKLNIGNLIGIGTDNASVMIGVNKSVYTELRKDVPSLLLVKCVCHSIQLYK